MAAFADFGSQHFVEGGEFHRTLLLNTIATYRDGGLLLLARADDQENRDLGGCAAADLLIGGFGAFVNFSADQAIAQVFLDLLGVIEELIADRG